MRTEVLRTMFAEEARNKTRAKTPSFEGMPKAGLKPWREVVTPHRDVASGCYQQARFAADLAQVIRGEGRVGIPRPDGVFCPHIPHARSARAAYLYLPRMRDQNVLMETMSTAISQLVCDSFAYAGRYDDAKGDMKGFARREAGRSTSTPRA